MKKGMEQKRMINRVTALTIPEYLGFDFCSYFSFSFHHGRCLFQSLQGFENVLMEFFGEEL